MNEAALANNSSMYDEVMEINQLNRVEGFDPRKYMRLIEGGTYYLDVVFRKLWFRLKHPHGKIVKKILKLTENVAIVEARVYLDRNDAEENYISNALAQRYLTDDDKFGNKYVELAETAAVGRALSDAGFGLQFADKEGDFDLEVTEAPIDARIIQGKSMIDEATYEECISSDEKGIKNEPTTSEDNMIPGQCGIEEYIPMLEEIERSMNRNIPSAFQQPVQSTIPVQSQQKPAQAINSSTGEIRKDMPVEQIYGMLNRDSAAKVVISTGYHKGKTLGQLSVEKPTALDWYVNSYAGPDNLLRAAAKFLLDAAFAKAS